jgi:hypothetical protein
MILPQANGEPGSVTQSLDIGSIRSVKVSKEGRRNIPKAFEIFTADKVGWINTWNSKDFFNTT